MTRAAKRETAQALAVRTADAYIGAITRDLPFDAAPGQVNLIQWFTQIQDALLRENDIKDDDRDIDMHHEDSAMRAGYLLGVQVGLRLRTKGVA